MLFSIIKGIVLPVGNRLSQFDGKRPLYKLKKAWKALSMSIFNVTLRMECILKGKVQVKGNEIMHK